MLQAELRVASGKQSGHIIPLVSSRFLIGREEDCHLRPNSDLVSRHHCVFKLDEYSLRVRDLGSSNGTFVNGERLRGEVILNTGDKIAVGQLDFEVAIGDAVSQPMPASVALGTADDQTDAYTMGDTPHSGMTIELPAFDPSEVDQTAQTMFVAPTSPPQSLQETMSMHGDTVAGYTPPPPPMQAPGYPMQQPPMGYPMPYPQQQQFPYGQPYGMPMMGYPQQPMPYPQMGAYPQQPMQPSMSIHYPAPAPAPVAAPVPEEPRGNATVSAPAVSLPNPSDTGAKPPEPPAPAAEGAAPNGKIVSVRDTAADIIKQYTQRRPQT